MDERDFVSKKREAWDRLAALVTKANGKRGVRALNREEIQALGPLYRRASSDLAYARARAVSSDLVQHLNSLVARAHALLYESETSGSPFRAMMDFYVYDFPAILQKRVRFFLFAVAVFLITGIYSYWQVQQNEEAIYFYIPEQMRSSVDFWKNGTGTHEAQVEFSSELMTHNFQVGLVACSAGVAFGIPTLLTMYQTGGMMGGMAAVMTQAHRHGTFWPGILPHGIAEVTAIFVCAAAGFLLGSALLFPGGYSRRDAFRLAGVDAIKLAIGSIPLFIFAGLMEGMFSRLPIPAYVRLGFAGLNGLLWYLYLFVPRRKPGTLNEQNLRNLPAA